MVEKGNRLPQKAVLELLRSLENDIRRMRELEWTFVESWLAEHGFKKSRTEDPRRAWEISHRKLDGRKRANLIEDEFGNDSFPELRFDSSPELRSLKSRLGKLLPEAVVVTSLDGVL